MDIEPSNCANLSNSKTDSPFFKNFGNLLYNQNSAYRVQIL